MNVRDSEIILGILQKAGFRQADSLEQADIILFNTCSVRRHAEERVWGQAGMLGKEIASSAASGGLLAMTGKRKARKIIGLVGCMAQNYKEEIFRRLPHVNLVCGPANIYDIPNLLKKVIEKNVQVSAVDKTVRPMQPDCGFRINTLQAFVNIMYGCNNFCSYCIVPYVRGSQLSRSVKHILEEVKDLAKRGCKEVTLLGQNVNSYGKDLKGKISFVGLLEKLDKIEGIERIRFVTSHPKDASKKLFQAMRDLPNVCKHLHLPLQSGSDKILRLMNRGYTLGDYLKLVDCFRDFNPGARLTTDIIVGFPGEREADFKKTYQAMQRIQFDAAFIFKYSPRPGTKAQELKDDVPVEVKQERNQILLKLQKEVSLDKKN